MVQLVISLTTSHRGCILYRLLSPYIGSNCGASDIEIVTLANIFRSDHPGNYTSLKNLRIRYYESCFQG